MRSIALATVLLFGAVASGIAQSAPSIPRWNGDAALTYHWVRTNAQPGQCGCIDLNGGGVSGSWNYRPQLAAVAEISGEHVGHEPATGNSLTLISYMAGARYFISQPWMAGPHSPSPFVQLLIGVGHAGGGIAGAGDASSAFVSRIGGGIDVPLNPMFSVRAIQVDYYLTHFANSTNNHQNNLLIGAGLAIHWSK